MSGGTGPPRKMECRSESFGKERTESLCRELQQRRKSGAPFYFSSSKKRFSNKIVTERYFWYERKYPSEAKKMRQTRKREAFVAL